MSQEHSRTNNTRFGEVYTSNLENDREPVLRRKEPYLKKMKSNRDHQMKLHRDG